MTMHEAIVSVRDLSVAFNVQGTWHKVVEHLSFDLYRGKTLALVGESGSGKSMTALAIMQLLPPGAHVSEQSQIYYEDRNLLTTSEKQMRNIRGGRIAMIFQDAMVALNPVYTIGQQMQEVFKQHLHLSGTDIKSRCYALLTEVGIKDPIRCFDAYPHQLSGGMRQRAMIAMALVADPDVLIADEPTTALDVTIQRQVVELLNKLIIERGMSMIFISHDLSVVSMLADDIVVMQAGIVQEQASCQQFFLSPQTAYSQQLLAAIPGEVRQCAQVSANHNILEVDSLKVHFPVRKGMLRRVVDYVKAVDDVSFTIKSGETVALVGESGSGKTTTGKAILQLLSSTSGTVIFNGIDVMQHSAKALRRVRSDMQIIFQDPYASLNPRLRVVDCILEGLIAQNKLADIADPQALVDELLLKVNLSPADKWKFPHEFSGGQRQRICIARALALNPALLILDEPTSALDVSIQMQIMELLQSLQEEYGLSYLLITHNLGVVAHMAHQVLVMYNGRLVEQGEVDKVLKRPEHPYTQELMSCIPKIKAKERLREQ